MNDACESQAQATDLKPADNITWKDLASGVVVLNLDSGTYYLLNDTASEAWRCILEGRGRRAIADHFLEMFTCTEHQATVDLDELFKYFIDEGFLVDKSAAFPKTTSETTQKRGS